MVDFIVVGAGSAGCVLANRLVAGGYRVALLEAGGKDNKTEIRIPAAFPKLFKTAYDWNYRTAPQAALAQRELYWPRAKVLGGCSSMNAQMWLPGHPADYDGWAASGNPGWDAASVRPFFEKAERPFDAGASGNGIAGGISVQPLRDPNPVTAAFVRACEEIGLPRPSQPGYGQSEGYGQTPVTQYRGQRFSAADGYLQPLLRHPNLRILLHARSERILFDGRRAVGVEYRDQHGQQRQLRAAREVVLAAGAVNSPQLLLLSGIGDPDALRRHGIPLLHALPGVGRNLQDHLLSAAVVSCPQPVTLAAAETLANLLRYLLLRKGMLTSNIAEGYAFIRTRPELEFPDVEIIFAPVPFLDHGLVPPKGHGITVGAVLLQPESRGTLELQSPEPAEPPRIDPGYLSDSAGSDLRTLVAGLKLSKRILASEALSHFAGDPIEPAAGATTDECLADFVREQSETLYHPVGTCRMGDDQAAVVDASLRVHGVGGLRVVDASVMPRIIRGHTHAPTVMIAEKAAEMILKESASTGGVALHGRR